MKIKDEFIRPSEIVSLYLRTLEKYKQLPDIALVVGGNEIGWEGDKFYLPDDVATAMEITGLDRHDFLGKSIKAHDKYSDVYTFCFVVDLFGMGIPNYLFEYLGMKDKFIRPDKLWLLIDRTYESQLPLIREYLKKLTINGL